MPYRPPGKVLTALASKRSAITNSINAAINYAFERADVGTRNGRPGEVDRLVYFFAEGLPLLESLLNYDLKDHKITVSISGIFCHKSPMVRHAHDARTCELADLAFLATYGKPLYKRGLGNAMLVQAKENFGEAPNSSQMALYALATEFTYRRPPRSPANTLEERRTFQDVDNALWNWSFAVNHRYGWPHSWPTEGILARPSQTDYHTPFSEVLTNLFMGCSGRGFDKHDPRANDIGWSRIIYDLLTRTAQKALVCDNCYVGEGDNVLKGEYARDSVRNIQGLDQHYLLKCTIDQTFERLGNPFTYVDKENREFNPWGKLTMLGKDFSWDRFAENHPDRFPKDHAATGAGDEKPPPPLGNNRGDYDDDDGTNGGSFVVVDFSEQKSR